MGWETSPIESMRTILAVLNSVVKDPCPQSFIDRIPSIAAQAVNNMMAAIISKNKRISQHAAVIKRTYRSKDPSFPPISFQTESHTHSNPIKQPDATEQ